MILRGVTLDFDDIKSCGLLPDLCIDWDHGSEELSENEKLISYWDQNVKELLDKTQNVVIGNIANKSVVYSADEEAIDLIKETFKEIELSSVSYSDIIECKECIVHDYLK
ncbi:MAG: hypothetical protein GY932_07580 [Arcobacter sp.]|nr:hypothetical protein [Arcobacter sp.]